MILIDTSVYIAAVEEMPIERALEELSQKVFVQSCEIIEGEIHDSSEFLRKTDRKQQSEELKAIYDKIREGTIRTSERIIGLSKEYHENAYLSRKHHKDIENDFLIVASAVVAGVKNIISFNRKTMCSENMIKVYDLVNSKHKYRTPKFWASREALSGFMESL